MKILVIAHDFPPNPSPQSLRWKYLSGELSARGHEVHVLTADVLPPTVALTSPEGVVMHRAFPGPLRGIELVLTRRKLRRSDAQPGHGVPSQVGEQTRLNWKGRLLKRIQRWGGLLLFPDIRGEWLSPARREFLRLVDRIKPDVVITSHEPATSLQLGKLVRKKGLPWVADLGDPVLAPYTPLRWRAFARRLEAYVCRHADAVIVTSRSARQLLLQRHGGEHSRITVLTQGFGRRPLCARQAVIGVVELLYSGRFYQFRAPTELLAAVVATEGVRLSIASIDVPQEVLDYASKYPQKISLLGFLPHEEVLVAQQDADVLVNIGNEDPTQIPGKFFEYLGAGRPILHLSQSPGNDEVGEILGETGRGWVVENRRDAIEQQLASIARNPVQPPPAPDDKVMDYAWDRIAGRLEEVLFLNIARRA